MNINLGGSRRRFLNQFGMGLGGLALADLMSGPAAASDLDTSEATALPSGAALTALHHAPRAKRVIYLFQAGAPSQMDLLDHKPLLNKLHGTQLPDEVRGGQRLTGMSGNQSSLPLVGSPFPFAQHGQSGTWMSDLLPHTAKIADEICVVKSMYTEAINHGPGVTFLQSGSQLPGRPSIGSWLSYGLGSENENLPAFVVLLTKNKGGQPLAARLWGSGFLPSEYQGVQFRSAGDPVLYLRNPAGVTAAARRGMLDAMGELHQLKIESESDPFVEARIAQHELAFRMQMSIPDVTDISSETQSTLDSYGPDVRDQGTFASNCLLARRLAERGVRFIQLYHQGWDQHGGLPKQLPVQCKETDQPAAALVSDLKDRGMLDDTLVVWGGEFGRTNYCQGTLTPGNFGRDHHPRCFTMWMAGGGVKPGISYGETDEYGYNVVTDPVHVHDFQATMMHLLGIDHERLTYRYQGRQFRLTDVHGNVVQPILA
ncbi:DUF1501 domain-containing protein [Allorhodopirellula heiligendammensis]|uniref:Sulfatase n=1 Tax=Allorhodopirellula heiligendammensis TaxID=2714739 RepID=A0A5C6BY12_9BACT|nr:DUF1501 domain-containing protein [Allorhodopirellula heiligendammensis]TWU15714.1 hypothetical protein Poly21_29110 [Allorhodopirellula heiligendammensis]